MYTKFNVNLTSKNSLKHLYLLQLILRKSPALEFNCKVSGFHKNVILNSPFHYKTVKSHLSSPTIELTALQTPPRLLNFGLVILSVSTLEYAVKI